MPTTPCFASIASAEGAVSAGAANQLDTLWRTAMAGQGGNEVEVEVESVP